VAEEAQQPETTPVPSPAPRTQYEFDAEENKVFAEASAHLQAGGCGVIVLVVAYHAILLGRWAFGGPPMYDRFRFVHVWLPLLLIVGAAAFMRAGRAFDRVVNTQGSDITHLMDGLRSLNGVFSWLSFTWVFILLAVILGAGAAVIHALGF
jgi:hypothetical protein